MKIERFEDLECWKASRELVRMVYEMTKEDPFCRDYGLCNQIQRSAVSVMANVAEGFVTQSDKEFMRFLDFSIRSAAEVQSHLYISLDLNYVNESGFEKAFKKSQDCINLCKGLIRYLKDKTSTLKHLDT